MPKLNIYVPDGLARAVKDARVPVSTVCQHALTEALRRSTAWDEEPTACPEDVPPFLRFALPVTASTADALGRSAGTVGGLDTLGTEHLAWGALAQGENLAVRALESLGVDPEQLRADLWDAIARRASSPAPRSNRLDIPATHALRRARDEVRCNGRPAMGCEHVLVAVLEERVGAGGRVLRRAGVDPAVARRAVVSVRAGILVGSPTAALRHRDTLETMVERLERIESLVRSR